MIPPMRSLEDIQTILRKQLPELRERYGVKSLRIFGSYARGEQTPESDVDILVEFDRKPGLLKFVNLEAYLSELLGVEVQLTTMEALREEFRDTVVREAVEV